MYYGYSHISIATPHLPFRYALFIFWRVSINSSQQRPCSRKTLATPRANVKHMSKAQTRTNNMKNWWKPKMKIKVRASEAKHAKLKREICRVARKICVAPSKKTRKSEQQEEGKDGEVCVTSDSFYTQMTWQHLLRQSGEFSTLPKYLPEACSRWSWSQAKSLIRAVCTLDSSSPNCHLMVH